jgi:flavin-dependent dehydrogenase
MRRFRVYDAIVVGARCAGAAAGMLLARKGYRVLLVDRATFPSDTWRLHFIHQPGVARLQRWGLLEQVAATCPPILKRTIDLGDFPLTGWAPPFESVAEAYSPRRFALDQILVNAALSAGAELRVGFSVQDLVWRDDRVVGIRGQHRGSVAEYARVVIGADGLHSKVAQAVEAPVSLAPSSRLLLRLLLERCSNRWTRDLRARPQGHVRVSDQRRPHRHLRRLAASRVRRRAGQRRR